MNANPFSTYLVNVMGAVNVLEASRLCSVERVVLISSEAAYHVVQREPIDETHPIFAPEMGSPTGHYGASKAAADIIGLTYSSWNNLDVRVVRLSSVYGPGMTADMYIRTMIENTAAGKPVRFATGGDMRRDYTYILDVVDGILKALDAASDRLTQRTFNISSGETVTSSYVAQIVRELRPNADIRIGSGLSIEERSSIRSRGDLDLAAARRILGYEPHFPLKEGIASYFAALERQSRARSEV
jgi:UDP-glucose 4-epimerase